ncbi:hypothetical protein ACHAPI_006073 [Fusarium lateritium]
MSSQGQKQDTKVSFQTLPIELVFDIRDLLPQADKVCLALTSKWGRWICGGIPRSDPFGKKELLSQLDDRAMWTSEIYCRICQRFHEPQKGLEPTSDEQGRPCTKPGVCWFMNKSWSENLPWYVHFDLLAAVARSHRLRLEPPVYPPSLLNSVESSYRDDGSLGSVIKHSVHFSSKGNVILKTEKIIRPGIYMPLTMDKTRALKEVLDAEPSMGNICVHGLWSEVFPFLFDKDGGYLCWNDKQWSWMPRAWNELTPMDALRECVWTHKGDCPSDCLVQRRLRLSLEGRVWSCAACATDSAINTVRMPSLPDEANFLVFTSWKDLGQCKDRLELEWQEHIEDVYGRDGRRRVLGEVAEEVEEVVKMETSDSWYNPMYYYPDVSEERVLELFFSED